MNNKGLAMPSGPGLSPSVEPASCLVGSATSIPIADVAAVVADLTSFFGPGYSNGVVAILLHDALPERFERECWKDWAFRPAERAFDWAHDRGLIVPWKLSQKWVFTDLGKAAAAYYQAAKGPVPGTGMRP